MPPDEEEERPQEAQEDDTNAEDTTDDTPEVDARVAELEAALAAANAQIEVLNQALFTFQVGELGLLADPATMPYNADLASDPDAMKAAVLALIAAQPNLAKIVVTGDVDQDARDDVNPPPFNLLSVMKEMI
jgi:hypothetical protein